MSESRRIKPAGPGYILYSPPAAEPDTKPFGLIRKRARRVGITIKNKGEQLLHRSGQPVPKPRLAPPRADVSYLIPQHHADPGAEARETLLDRVFHATELTVDSRPRPLASHPPRRDSIHHLQTEVRSHAEPSDTASPYPQSPGSVTQDPLTPQIPHEALAELSSEPTAEYAAEYVDAELRYRDLSTSPFSPPRPKSREDPLSAAKHRSRRSSRMVPAVADGRPPYPVTPPTSPQDSAHTSLPPRIPEALTLSRVKLQHSPKRAITMDDSLPTKRRRMSRLSISRTAQLSRELHFEDSEPFNKVSIPSRADIAEPDGNATCENKKALKRSSHSMPDLHFDFGFPVNETRVGFTRSGSPVGLKVGPSPIRKGLFIDTADGKAAEIATSVPWKTYAPNTTRASMYKAFIRAGLPGDLSEEVTIPVQALKSQKLRNRNYTAYIPNTEAVHELVPEAFLSEEGLKAQKLKNRISSGFMPDQTPLTDVIRAATETSLISTDFTNTMQDVESPVSPLEPLVTAWAGKRVMTTAIHVCETCEDTRTAPTTFDDILRTPANEVEEIHLRSSEPESSPVSEPALVGKIVDLKPVTYQTLRRVRAARVEMRTLARPLPPGGSTNSNSLLDAPVPTTLTSSRSSRQFHPTTQKDDDDSSWNWGRFVDKDYEDPAAEVSRRFRQKKVWAKNNTGPLVDFEGRGYGTNLDPQDHADEKDDNSKRWSWRQMAKGKTVEELLNLFEGR